MGFVASDIGSRFSTTARPILDADRPRLRSSLANECLAAGPGSVLQVPAETAATRFPSSAVPSTTIRTRAASARHPTVTSLPTETHWQAARETLRELDLRELEPPRGLASGHRNSLPIVAQGGGGRMFLFKYYLPLPPETILPSGARSDARALRRAIAWRSWKTRG